MPMKRTSDRTGPSRSTHPVVNGDRDSGLAPGGIGHREWIRRSLEADEHLQ